jgi:hypothetical protein
MANKISSFLGILFILIGIVGFFDHNFAGTHLSLVHNLIHIGSGALALYFGIVGTPVRAKLFVLVFGAFYLGLGVIGMWWAESHPSTLHGEAAMGSTGNMFKIIPGILELGTVDHILHILIGLLFIFGGIMTKASVTNVIEPEIGR